MAIIKIKRGPTVPTGLTAGELAFDYTNGNLFIGATGSTISRIAGTSFVSTFNGLSGAVSGVTTGTANTFTALQSFNSGISAAGGITFNAPISSTRLLRTSSVVFDTKTGNFSPAEADNGKVFVINISGKTTVTVTLDGLSTGWRAKFLVLGGTGVFFSSSLGTVLGTYGADGGGVGAITELVEVYCYGTGTYFAG